jgi:hypothetical protein
VLTTARCLTASIPDAAREARSDPILQLIQLLTIEFVIEQQRYVKMDVPATFGMVNDLGDSGVAPHAERLPVGAPARTAHQCAPATLQTFPEDLQFIVGAVTLG